MNKTSKIMLGLTLLLVVLICIEPTSADSSANMADFTEGGHLETDYNVGFMAEWWYLNGRATLASSDGEEKDIGFFVTLAHQESPITVSLNGTQRSHLLTFYGLYFDNGTTTFNYTGTYIPQTTVGNYIALHTPYVDYVYPDGVKRFNGSALSGYNLNYTSDDLDDGYDDYSYKHMALLDKHNGTVLADYSADEILITETDWITESEFNRKRPVKVVFSTPDLNVTVNAESVIDFKYPHLINMGFVNFMAFQPDDAVIQYNGSIEAGSAFYEYFVSDVGVITPPASFGHM